MGATRPSHAGKGMVPVPCYVPAHVCGTFVPAGGEDLTDFEQEHAWLSSDAGACGHEELGVDPGEFDVIFAYPWPGEEAVIEGLFERYAPTGALLLTFHGHEDLRLRRRA